MKNLDFIFLVFGNSVNRDFSNIKSIDTKVIPLIGDTIVLKDGIFSVIGRSINYKNVEGYAKNQDGRGGEMIYIFLENQNKF